MSKVDIKKRNFQLGFVHLYLRATIGRRIIFLVVRRNYIKIFIRTESLEIRTSFSVRLASFFLATRHPHTPQLLSFFMAIDHSAAIYFQLAWIVLIKYRQISRVGEKSSGGENRRKQCQHNRNESENDVGISVEEGSCWKL